MPKYARDDTLIALESLHKHSSGLPRLLVTAGPTCEDIDTVRFITNHSTGRMGIEIAQLAASRGWAVLLVLGPTNLPAPEGVQCVNVRSAEQMFEAVKTGFGWCDSLVMTAAVADYMPVETFPTKKKKEEGELLLRLKRTPDILAHTATHPSRSGKTVIGFALEDNLDIEEGRRKLESKQLDAIIVNTIESFGSNYSIACMLRNEAPAIDLGRTTKSKLAHFILNEIETRQHVDKIVH